MTAMTRARGETSGRMNRETPQAPSGMQARRRIRCSVPMAPKSTVPVMPAMPNAGDAGAVVPTPADCQPEKKWCQLVDHDGSGASWPTSGRVPKNRSRVPTAITSSATTTATARCRPVLRGAERTRRPKRSRPARRPRSSSSSKSVSSLKADPTLPVSTATSARSPCRSGRSLDPATALAAVSPWCVSRLTYCDRRALPRTCSRRTSASGKRRCWASSPRSTESSVSRRAFQRHAPVTARTRSRSRASTATITSPSASRAAWGSTRTRWMRV